MAIPNVSGALRGWTQRRTVTLVTKAIENFQTVETTTSKKMLIHVQPMPAKQVDRKPEEQRSWKWWTIWLRDGGKSLNTDDIVVVDEKGYRIEKVKDWRPGGYTEYEAVEDYTDNAIEVA